MVSLNPVFTEEQQQANPLLKKFAKGGKKGKESISTTSSSVRATQATTLDTANFQTNAVVQNSATAHPLSNHPFFKNAIDKLSPTLVNLLDIPGKF